MSRRTAGTELCCTRSAGCCPPPSWYSKTYPNKHIRVCKMHPVKSENIYYINFSEFNLFEYNYICIYVKSAFANSNNRNNMYISVKRNFNLIIIILNHYFIVYLNYKLIWINSHWGALLIIVLCCTYKHYILLPTHLELKLTGNCVWLPLKCGRSAISHPFTVVREAT